MIRQIKKLINQWRNIKQAAEGYETLGDRVNELDTRVYELESMITRIQVEYRNDYDIEEDGEPSHTPIQLTIYEYIDELPFQQELFLLFFFKQFDVKEVNNLTFFRECEELCVSKNRQVQIVDDESCLIIICLCIISMPNSSRVILIFRIIKAGRKTTCLIQN